MANCSACGHSKEQHRPVCFVNTNFVNLCNCDYFEAEDISEQDKYCDSCLAAAYDEVGNGLEAQIQILDQMAYLLPDHLCDHGEEPDIPCECRAHRFNRVH